MNSVNLKIWFAVDEDGTEWIFGDEPERRAGSGNNDGFWEPTGDYVCPLPLGQINAWTGNQMEWENAPWEMIGPNYDPSPDTQPSEQ
jgi:hypothetical protein